jgi:hypothetical protein
VLFNERDKDFVGELAGLPEVRIRTDLDEFAVDARVERYRFDAGRGALDVVTKKSAGHAQQRVLHEHLVD